jgi:hypothetical protein
MTINQQIKKTVKKSLDTIQKKNINDGKNILHLTKEHKK